MRIIIFLFCLILPSPLPAQTVLGTKTKFTPKVQSSNIQKQAATAQSEAKFTTNEYFNENQIKIREYINHEGIVFAVTWSGLSHPPLAPLLGSYYEDYQNNKLKPHRRLPKITISSNDLVVEKFGRMRAVQGRALVKSLIPQGVLIEEIK
jgi:hypothetical protein